MAYTYVSPSPDLGMVWNRHTRTWESKVTSVNSRVGEISYSLLPGLPDPVYEHLTNTNPKEALVAKHAVVEFDLTYADGTTDTVSANRAVASDGLITFYDKNGNEAAVFNQDLVRKYVPVTETDKPEVTLGAYTFVVNRTDGSSNTVRADLYQREGSEEEATFVFKTKLPSGDYRNELTVPFASVKDIVRTEAPATVADATLA